jgi:hypothetical protein
MRVVETFLFALVKEYQLSRMNHSDVVERPAEKIVVRPHTRTLVQSFTAAMEVDPKHEVYAPNAELAKNAHIKSMEQYREMYARSVGPESNAFWAEVLVRFRPFDSVFSQLNV